MPNDCCLEDFRRNVIQGFLAEKLVELRINEDKLEKPIQKRGRNASPEVKFSSCCAVQKPNLSDFIHSGCTVLYKRLFSNIPQWFVNNLSTYIDATCTMYNATAEMTFWRYFLIFFN